VTLRNILHDLLKTTTASRTTLRLYLPERDLYVDRVAAEAVAAGVRSIGEDSSINQACCLRLNLSRRSAGYWSKKTV